MLGRAKKWTAAAGVAALTVGASLAATAGTAAASPTPLPAYPATTTLDLGSPNCVADDVIMNDPLDSTSPITDTYGSASGKLSQAIPPVTYYLWYLNNLNTWTLAPPPGTQINKTTGVISSYDGKVANQIAGDLYGTGPASGSVTYTVRDHGKDAVGAVGTEQFQLKVNNSGGTGGPGSGPVVTVSYEGNTFNNANGALTIQLNGGSTTSTALTLSAIASSLNIPEVGGVGSTPVVFALVNTTSGWHLSGGSSTAVLTGTDASDPEFTATTADHDKVFFTLSGISTTSAGVFYLNNDANPCVTGPPATPPPPPPTSPPPTTSNYGDFVNGFGNGFDVYQQRATYNNKIIGWPATQHDSATHFLLEPEGSNFRLEYAPDGAGTGLCVSNPGNDLLVLRSCNPNVWQQFKTSGKYIISVASGGYVNPDGTGGQLSAGSSPTPWGGSKYHWTAESSLPA